MYFEMLCVFFLGAQFDSPRGGLRTSSESSTSSNGSRSRTPTTGHAHSTGIHPGYSIMSVGTPTETTSDKFRQPPNTSPRLARHSNRKTYDENRASTFTRQDSSSPVSLLPETAPSPSPTSPIVLSSRASSVINLSYPTQTPPRTPRTPTNHHKYEDADKFRSTPPPPPPPPSKLPGSTTATGNHGNYDRLLQQNETSSPNTSTANSGVSPPYSGIPHTVNGTTPNTGAPINSYETVEKRVKSPSPKAMMATVETRSSSNSPPLTDTELSHLRHYNKEPLINTSNTIHNRRRAEYIYIDLPDSSSDCTDSDSRPGSLYDIPTSNKPIDGRNSYDEVPPPRPLLPPPPISHQKQHANIYNLPRKASTESLSPLNRALPHLPTDYVNVMFNLDKTALLTEDLYSEIPNPASIKDNQQLQPNPNNIPPNNPNISPNNVPNVSLNSDKVVSQLQLEVPGQKLAQELAEEEGYILVNPATLPAIVSPPPTTDMPKLSPGLTMDDEYIEIRRTGPDILVPPLARPLVKHEYVNVPSTSSKRDSDGYEEVTELRKVCPLKTSSQSPESHVPVDMNSLSLTSNDLITTRCLPHERQVVNSEEVINMDEPLELNDTLSSGSLKEDIVLSNEEFSEIKLTRGDSQDMSSLSFADITEEESSENIENIGESTTITETPKEEFIENITENIEESTTITESLPTTEPFVEDIENKPPEDITKVSEDLKQHEDFTTPLKEEPSSMMQPITEPISVPETFKEPLTEFQASPDTIQEETMENSSSSLPKSEVPSSNDDDIKRISSYEYNQPKSIPIPQVTALVPVHAGSPTHPSLLRKRSLTVGDALDQKENKKHTYVNVPGDIPLPSTPPPPQQSYSPPVYKKPMPLPRPQPAKLSFLTKSMSFQATTDNSNKESHFPPLTVNSNYNNNYCASKVRTLIRQFSD